MSNNEIAVPPAPAPAMLGQATAVEQSRAVAEVQAAVLVARQFPRDEQRAIRKLTQACGQESLASRAFFRFSRGGSPVTGPSIHLARTIAACWGNTDYGIAEMRRDDIGGESEMKAWAWDQEDNTRTSNTFIVPHTRDTKDGPKKLNDSRDVYENNANQGARRVRECIFALVPVWFVEMGKDLCRKTLKDGGGKPLPQRIAETVANFEKLRVTMDQLERKVERPTSKWTEEDVAALWVIGKSLQNGEISRDEEFPPERVSVDDLGDPPVGAGEQKASRSLIDHIKVQFTACQVIDQTERLANIRLIAGRTDATLADLTRAEAAKLRTVLDECAVADDPQVALADALTDLDRAASEAQP